MNLDFFLRLAKPNLKQEGMKRAYARCQDVDFGVKMS